MNHTMIVRIRPCLSLYKLHFGYYRSYNLLCPDTSCPFFCIGPYAAAGCPPNTFLCAARQNQYQNFFEVGVKLLSEPHLGSEVKKMIRAKLEDLTMSISVNKNKKLPTDRMTIGQKNRKKVTDIHRTRAEYDFDEETCRGCGLLTETLELDTDEFML